MIHELTEEVKAAHRAQREELQRLYPKGTLWNVRLSARQKNPSIMQVSDHYTGCNPSVRFMRERPLDRWKRYQAPLWRAVPLDNILGPA